MTKSQLADSAGVSVKTLMNWLKPYRGELEKMGLGPYDKLLKPDIVKFIVDKTCIDID